MDTNRKSNNVIYFIFKLPYLLVYYVLRIPIIGVIIKSMINSTLYIYYQMMGISKKARNVEIRKLVHIYRSGQYSDFINLGEKTIYELLEAKCRWPNNYSHECYLLSIIFHMMANSYRSLGDTQSAKLCEMDSQMATHLENNPEQRRTGIQRFLFKSISNEPNDKIIIIK